MKNHVRWKGITRVYLHSCGLKLNNADISQMPAILLNHFSPFFFYLNIINFQCLSEALIKQIRFSICLTEMTVNINEINKKSKAKYLRVRIECAVIFDVSQDDTSRREGCNAHTQRSTREL